MNVKHCLLLLQRRSAGINRKFAASHEVLERNHRWVIIMMNAYVTLLLYNVHYPSHEREVDAKTKSNSLPIPRAVAYRPTSGQQPSLPVLQSDSPQPMLANGEADNQPTVQSEENRQSLQKRIQLLQDHNLKLLNHIKVFREAIDKVNGLSWLPYTCVCIVYVCVCWARKKDEK